MIPPRPLPLGDTFQGCRLPPPAGRRSYPLPGEAITNSPPQTVPSPVREFAPSTRPGDELLLADDRTALTPSEQVDRRVAAALGRSPGSLTQPRALARPGPR